MLSYLFSQFLIKIKTTTTIIHSQKNVRMNYLKVTIINKFLYKLQMLYFDKIDVSKGIYINKRSASKKSAIIATIGIFQIKCLSFNHMYGCHYVLMMSMSPSDIVILNIDGGDYCCVITGIIKSEVINLMENIDLSLKSETL